MHSVGKRHWPAIDEEAVGLGRCWRGLTPIIGLELLACRVPIEDESAAADARGLRLDQIEHELGGDRRIDRRAARAQHFAPGFGGVGVGGGHHVPVGAGQHPRIRLRRPFLGFGSLAPCGDRRERQHLRNHGSQGVLC